MARRLIALGLLLAVLAGGLFATVRAQTIGCGGTIFGDLNLMITRADAQVIISPCGSATNYYVATGGSDAANGLTPTTAWQTITHVNAQTFTTPSIVNFNGGQSFSGTIALTTSNVTNGNITIQSYGTGQATISQSSNSASCLTAVNVPSVTINNVICTGTGNNSSAVQGIVIENTGAANLAGPTISGVTISAYGQDCIAIVGTGSNGFNNVSVTNSTAHDCTGNAGNTTAGINVNAFTGANTTAFSNVTITGNTVYNQIGRSGAAAFTGAGIFCGNVTTCLISNNYIHDNGADSAGSSGPSGITAYYCTNCTFKFNEVVNTRTGNSVDGNGIDCDMTVTNCIIEYNYTHNNFARGLYAYGGTTTNSGTVIRFNISQGDGVGLGAIAGTGGTITGGQFYNNTIYGVADTAVLSSGTVTATFANNIFYALAGTAINVATPSSQTFNGNDYFGSVAFKWNGTTYTTFAAFASGATQEASGQNHEPRLVVYGGGGTTSGYAPASLNEYQLQSGSPMLSAGLNLTTVYSINPGAQDYYGDSISAAALPIGAGQQVSWTSGTTTSCSQYTTFLARMSSPPVLTQQQTNALLCGMVADGTLSLLDTFYKLATDSTTDAALNFISTSYSLVSHGTITFAANTGYTGDASTGYLDTTFVPSTAGGVMTQNSADVGAYVVSSRTTSEAWVPIGTENSAATSTINILPFLNVGSNINVACLNESQAACANASATNAKGFYIGVRTGSAATAFYENGASIATGTGTSVALSNESILIGAQNSGTGPVSLSGDQIAYAFSGEALTANQQFLLSYRVDADAIALGINAF